MGEEFVPGPIEWLVCSCGPCGLLTRTKCGERTRCGGRVSRLRSGSISYDQPTSEITLHSNAYTNSEAALTALVTLHMVDSGGLLSTPGVFCNMETKYDLPTAISKLRYTDSKLRPRDSSTLQWRRNLRICSRSTRFPTTQQSYGGRNGARNGDLLWVTGLGLRARDTLSSETPKVSSLVEPL